MNAVFVFDGPMYCDCNGVYCNTTITTEMLSRYLTVAENLYVIIRTIHLKSTYIEAKLERVTLSPQLQIIEIPNLLTPKEFLRKHRYKSLIKRYIQQSELIFLRIPSVISNMAAAICQKLGKPYFAEVGGCAWDSFYNHSVLGKIVAPYMYYKQKRVVRRAAVCSYVTQKWLQGRYPTNGESYIASNVYLNVFDEENINKRVNSLMTTIPIKIGTIASVDVKYKGQEYVIEAIAMLKKKGYNLQYELVGAGKGERLKKLVEDKELQTSVKFLGVKLHKDIWNWLDSIDIYVQPSKQEGLPRALIEAMNRGCLTLGSTTAGIPELIEDDTIFKNGNSKQIARILEMLILERDHSYRIIRNFNKSKDFAIDKLNRTREIAYNRYVLLCTK